MLLLRDIQDQWYYALKRFLADKSVYDPISFLDKY